MTDTTPTGGARHADLTTINNLIENIKLAGKYFDALVAISEIDGSDPVEDIRIARAIARKALHESERG